MEGSTGFDILSNLPLLFFIFALIVVFILFLFGGFVLLSAGGDVEKIERGRRILLNSFCGLFIILVIVFVFFLLSHLLQKGEVSEPPEVTGEFPPSPAANFPPPPQFIEIGKYYFTGIWSLKENNLINKAAVYAILCKKDGEYDIIYIGEAGKAERLLEHEQYRCWMEKCSQKLQNIYFTIFPAPSGKKIKEELTNQINPPCPPEK